MTLSLIKLSAYLQKNVKSFFGNTQFDATMVPGNNLCPC